VTIERLARRWPGGPAVSRVTVVAAVIVFGSAGVLATTDLARALQQAPHETRMAGAALQAMARPGDRVIARKPHVAWYGHIGYARMPIGPSLGQLPLWAQTQGVRYLFFSGIEQVQQPEWAVLSDSGVVLPGFRQVSWRSDGQTFFALYEFGPPPDSGAFASALGAALLRFEERHKSAETSLFVAAQYLALGDARSARTRLDALVRGGYDNVAIQRYRASAGLALNDLTLADQALTKVIATGQPVAWDWARLGDVRMQQRRPRDAAACYERASVLAPATIGYAEQHGKALISAREFRAAARVFDECVKKSPLDPQMRRLAMGAYQLCGEPGQMQRIYEDGIKRGIRSEAMLDGVAAGPG
jgi:Tfp pilus assembly protein PilF